MSASPTNSPLINSPDNLQMFLAPMVVDALLDCAANSSCRGHSHEKRSDLHTPGYALSVPIAWLLMAMATAGGVIYVHKIQP